MQVTPKEAALDVAEHFRVRAARAWNPQEAHLLSEISRSWKDYADRIDDHKHIPSPEQLKLW